MPDVISQKSDTQTVFQDQECPRRFAHSFRLLRLGRGSNSSATEVIGCLRRFKGPGAESRLSRSLRTRDMNNTVNHSKPPKRTIAWRLPPAHVPKR
jgi:hypothetical protein